MKYLVCILFLVVGFSLQSGKPVLAQSSDSNVSINVSAQVISSIELITIQSLRLAQEEAQNETIQIAPRTSSNVGKMIAIGTPNSDIRISFLPSKELTRLGSTDNILFHYSIAGNTEDDQTTAELLDQENRDFELNENGRFYLWIGGLVDISTAVPGNYQGEFTLEIEYI